MSIQVVWFKRDLRVVDNEAFFKAVHQGATIPLYVFEPDLWRQPDMSGRHFEFLVECLQDLDRELRSLGQPLVIRTGDVCEILERIHDQYTIDALWSHQETWNGWTYKRDLKVKAWCRRQGIRWEEPRQHGVRRGAHSRKGWASHWEELMTSECFEKPVSLSSVPIEIGHIPQITDLKIYPDTCPERQEGGRTAAIQCLNSFFGKRGINYQREMSSPLTAYDSCSRLSSYLAFGALSTREVYQAAINARRKNITNTVGAEKKQWNKAIQAFISRLYWHCHFIQKLEDEPELEFRSLHADMEDIRDGAYNEEHLIAWQRGQTGFPLIDACMRALNATGWINFRMRAMLMSFATYQLWIPWRKPSLHLARLFVDYEPGIHYSQCQMQSGATGANTIRIYNPVKQGLEQDPDATFIKKWVPELAGISPARIHEVQSIHLFCPEYPTPIVDEKSSRKQAAEIVFALKKQPGFKEKSRLILRKHSSEKAGLHRFQKNKIRKQRTSTRTHNSNQLELPF